MSKRFDEKDGIVSLPSSAQIEDEAASWLVVFEREQVSEELQAEFQIWIDKNPRHKEAFDRLSNVWGELAQLTVLEDHAEAVTATPQFRAVSTQHWSFFAIAASICLVMIGGWIYMSLQSAELNDKAYYETATGEQKEVVLPDGSTVHLNTGTRLAIDFNSYARNLTLFSGEAYFEVAKNARRPFSVIAGEGRVTALGTIFSVRLLPSTELEVLVEEGRVAIAPILPDSKSNDQPKYQPATLQELSAGSYALFDEQIQTVQQIEAKELHRKLSWRQGMLVYKGEPLSEVVTDISRYTDYRIEIVDSALHDLPIGGYFQIGDIEELFESLELNLGIHIERVGTDHVRLTAKL